MTLRALHLAKHLTLPLDAVSRTFGILAVRGAGKSNTAAVMAEEMFAAGLPFVVIDPVGSWYGLRSSSDGTTPGLPIPIFGGKHGDVPLERAAGEMIADLIVEKRLTCVLDLSRFDSESDKKAFLLSFARRLYAKNENPLHLFLEEADDYIPQSPMGDEKQLLRAWENIVRRGRARGLGMTLITQRSAAVAKMVLTQVETLFAMRTTGPQDIAAIEAWVKYHQVGKDVLSTLAGLEDGEAWVWSPHYLKTMSRHQIRRRQTFDSGATPQNVRARDSRPPATLADIDITALKDRMAATIEKAKADDPRELRKQIAELRAQLAAAAQVNTKTAPICQPMITDGDRHLLTQVAEAARLLSVNIPFDVSDLKAHFTSEIERFVSDVTTELKDRRAEFVALFNRPDAQALFKKIAAVSDPGRNVVERRPVAVGRVAPVRPSRTMPSVDGVGKAEQRLLDAIAWWKAAGVDMPTRHQVAFVARYTVNGHINNMFGALRGKGFIDYPSGGGVSLTEAGARAAAPVDEEPSRTELVSRVLEVLKGEAQRRIFSAIVEAGRDLSREELAEATNYTVNGHFNNMVGSLRSLGLVEYPTRGGVRLSTLFDALRG